MNSLLARFQRAWREFRSLPQRVATLEKFFDAASGTTRELTQRLAKLEQASESMSALTKAALAPQYDVVRLDNVSLFVPTHDNLYDRFVPAECKRFPMENHYALLDEAPPTMEELQSTPGNAMLLYLDILWAHGFSVRLVDIGAWVGDVALRLAKFAKQRGAPFEADCYDPSLAGRLIPFNIALNGLSDRVRTHPVGLSLTGAPTIFCQFLGHSDSSRLQDCVEESHDSMPMIANFVVDTKTLADCLPAAAENTHVFVKLDVEGIDALATLQCLDRLTDTTLAIEFAPLQRQYGGSPGTFIDRISVTHTLLDTCYLPKPTRADLISDSESLIADVLTRPYGYTDLLAVPKSLRAHAELVSALSSLPKKPLSYMLA